MSRISTVRGVSTVKTRQKRRSTEEVRELLLGAARELFTANGYDATSTRDICARAGVARNLLFSNFENKQQLFEAAVLAPFSEFLDGYAQAWTQLAPDATPEQLVETWVRRLYDLAQDNRVLLATSVARRITIGGDAGHDVLDVLADMFDELDEFTRKHGIDRRYAVDGPISTGAAAAMVIGSVLFRDLVFARRSRPELDRDRLVRELTTMIVDGIAHRPPLAAAE